MISESNVKDLMLRKEVVEAVKNNQFQVYAVKTVDEGIEILTGQPADKVNDLVDKKFRELAENLKNFGETEEKEDKKDKKSSCKNC
jgi:predicted ATP-dependent protease